VLPRHLVRTGEARDRQPGRIGLMLRWVEDAATVWEVLPDTPAAASPLAPGFVVTALDGRDREALEREHASAVGHVTHPSFRRVRPFELQCRKQAGEELVVSYLDAEGRHGETRLVAIEQEKQANPRFAARRLGDVLLLAFKEFCGDVAAQFPRAIGENRDARALVVDLRGNPGGNAHLPGELASWLVRASGTLGRFVFRGSATTLDLPGRADAFAGPVAMLVVARSASCSEILAGVLQEIGRCRVFGRRSIGAVLPSTEVLLPNGCKFQHVICDYVTPGGRRLEGAGVVPDDGEIDLTRADLLAGRDRDLEAALAWLEPFR
jgi:C-terminal processing protease CtpA/Prc